MTEAPGPRITDLPSPFAHRAELAERIGAGTPVVCLDYDGTLTPIVSTPDAAALGGAARAALERLAAVCPVAIVSGRDVEDVRARVGLSGLHYAGSHGFEIVEPDGTRHRTGEEYRPALARAADRLERGLSAVPGALVERKGFAVAVHYRMLEDPRDAARVEAAVDEVAAGEPELRTTGGRMIFELRPNLPWDKGAAVLRMLELLGAGPDDVPLYVGDDLTDEDAFRALRERGIGVVVAGEEPERGTLARYALGSPEEVPRFLDEIASLVAGSRASRP